MWPCCTFVVVQKYKRRNSTLSTKLNTSKLSFKATNSPVQPQFSIQSKSNTEMTSSGQLASGIIQAGVGYPWNDLNVKHSENADMMSLQSIPCTSFVAPVPSTEPPAIHITLADLAKWNTISSNSAETDSEEDEEDYVRPSVIERSPSRRQGRPPSFEPELLSIDEENSEPSGNTEPPAESHSSSRAPLSSLPVTEFYSLRPSCRAKIRRPLTGSYPESCFATLTTTLRSAYGQITTLCLPTGDSRESEFVNYLASSTLSTRADYIAMVKYLSEVISNDGAEKFNDICYRSGIVPTEEMLITKSRPKLKPLGIVAMFRDETLRMMEACEQLSEDMRWIHSICKYEGEAETKKAVRDLLKNILEYGTGLEFVHERLLMALTR